MKAKNLGLLLEDSKPMSRAFDLLADLPEDMFAEGRKDDPPYPRENATKDKASANKHRPERTA